MDTKKVRYNDDEVSSASLRVANPALSQWWIKDGNIIRDQIPLLGSPGIWPDPSPEQSKVLTSTQDWPSKTICELSGNHWYRAPFEDQCRNQAGPYPSASTAG